MSIGKVDLSVAEVEAHAEERVFSEAELAIICDLVVWHQLPHFSAHELVRFPGCSRWSVWAPGNMQRVVAARREDDTRDWYFPISVTNWYRKAGEFIPPERSFTWLGLWHPTANASSKVRRLPPMTCMLQDWHLACFPLCEIVASEGGLLLIKARAEVVPVRRSSRASRYQAYSTPGESRRLGSETPDDPCSTKRSGPSWHPHLGHGHSTGRRGDWIRLLVCNPMTRECKELPEANCADMGWERWCYAYREGVQAHMEVDDEANSYQVVLILQNFVAVYKSTTNSWNCVQFQANHPWTVGPGWTYHGAIPGARRQLYGADIRSANVVDLVEHEEHGAFRVGILRLFHADVEAGRWTLVHKYRLRWYQVHSLNPYPDIVGFLFRILEDVELVGCMGSLYAVIPSWLHNVLAVGEKPTSRLDFERPPGNECLMSAKGPKFMPLVFYLVRLEGDGEVVALLRIPDLPLATGSAKDGGGRVDHEIFNRLCRSRTFQSRCWGKSWFTCEARGSVIWVFFQDCLLSFDVVLRKYGVRPMLLDRTFEGMSHKADWSHFSFRPNFQMRP